MNKGTGKIFALGYSDNTSTAYILNYLIKNGITIDGVIFPKNQLKRSWKRLLMKLRVRGFMPVVRRIFENLIVKKKQISEIYRQHIEKVFFVDQINSAEAREILIANHAELLILTATPIIKPILIDIDDLTILNAHTGLLPEYRGLDGNFKALRDGKQPGVTIHRVTEKIDAGEIYLREKFQINNKENIYHQIDRKELELAGELFVEAIDLYTENKLKPIVISKQLRKYEPPLTIKEKKRILQKVRNEAA